MWIRADRRDLQTEDNRNHLKIVSGGQTGVDRAALDVALKLQVECGGWSPAGRLAEDGRIPAHYPLRELASGGFAERTHANVRDSDGTVILFFEEPYGGTAETIRCCRELQRPHLRIDAAHLSSGEATVALANFALQHRVDVLNVAGPRASEWAGGYDYAARVLERFLSASSGA